MEPGWHAIGAAVTTNGTGLLHLVDVLVLWAARLQDMHGDRADISVDRRPLARAATGRPTHPAGTLQVGLDNAGKTTTLYRLHLGETVKTAPTIGSNVRSRMGLAAGSTAGEPDATAVSRPGAPRTPQVEVVRHENLEFEVWDLGGQANLRPSWATYYRGKGLVLCTVLVRRTGTACRLPEAASCECWGRVGQLTQVQTR